MKYTYYPHYKGDKEVTIINKSNSTRYSSLAHRDLMPGTKSADIDAAGFTSALKKVIQDCKGSFYIRLNNEERSLLAKLTHLDEVGVATKLSGRPTTPSPLEQLLKREAEASARKIASIKAERAREEAINNEANYTSRTDIDEARKKAMNIRGEVAAKKLDKTTEATSLADLIGDNKFIEESMKHSNIATTVASEEGWDMAKMNAPKVNSTAETEETVPQAEPVEDKPASTAKKSSRRKTKKENE